MSLRENCRLVYNLESQMKSMKSILCAYQNRTNSLQIIKIENIDNFHWEKVIFPWQRILFNAMEQAELTIYSNDNITAILTDTIDCLRLQVSDSMSV